MHFGFSFGGVCSFVSWNYEDTFCIRFKVLLMGRTSLMDHIDLRTLYLYANRNWSVIGY